MLFLFTAPADVDGELLTICTQLTSLMVRLLMISENPIAVRGVTFLVEMQNDAEQMLEKKKLTNFLYFVVSLSCHIAIPLYH